MTANNLGDCILIFVNLYLYEVLNNCHALDYRAILRKYLLEKSRIVSQAVGERFVF